MLWRSIDLLKTWLHTSDLSITVWLLGVSAASDACLFVVRY